ncbi:hypothetical protein LCGC14_2523230 [marine sediment metagenome]|uniref:Uncharacterized protein n=1 Tax=marine sediment metagenome TaxID=412755 RepID=A0A0F9DP18_9ZZZZ
MPKLKFFDVKAKESFETDKFTKFERKVKGGTIVFAQTKSPLTGIKATRIIGRKK